MLKKRKCAKTDETIWRELGMRECLVSFNDANFFFTRGVIIPSLNAKQISHIRTNGTNFSMREEAHHVDKLTNGNSRGVNYSYDIVMIKLVLELISIPVSKLFLTK